MTIWTPDRIKAARACCYKWHGVAHSNRSCVPGVAIDCIHLIREILVEASLVERVPLRYYNPQLGAFEESDHVQRKLLASLFANEADPETPEFGDIAVFKTGRFSGHAAFYCDSQLWHSLHRIGVTRSDYAIYTREIQTLIRITAPGWRSIP